MKFQFIKKNNDFLKKDESQIKTSFFWKIILYLTFAIIVVSFVFGFNLFYQINKESAISSTSTSSQLNSTRKDRIEKVLSIFSDREKKSTQILSTPPAIVDPSL